MPYVKSVVGKGIAFASHINNLCRRRNSLTSHPTQYSYLFDALCFVQTWDRLPEMVAYFKANNVSLTKKQGGRDVRGLTRLVE